MYSNHSNNSVIDLVQVLLRYLNYNGHTFLENALYISIESHFNHIPGKFHGVVKLKILSSIIFHISRASLLFALITGSAYATSTADHTKFKELQKHFSSGPEVTKTCIKCHTEAAKQIHKTKHWTWEFLNPENKQRLGKKNIVNNFCITPKSNFEHCAACHVGYGWKDDTFDFTSKKMSIAWSVMTPQVIT